MAKLEPLSIEQIKYINHLNNNDLYKNFNNLFNDVVSLDYAIEINTLLTSLAPYQNYFHEALEESCKKTDFYKPAIEEALNSHCVNIVTIGIDNTMIVYSEL